MTFFSHAGTRQDEWVLNLFDYKRHGFFVEAGANDGVRHSNTIVLERVYGWTGRLVEPNDEARGACLKNRPTTPCSSVVLGDKPGMVNFVSGIGKASAYSGIKATLPPGWFEGRHIGNSFSGKKMCVTLNDFLKAEAVPRTVDYLSLDVEGAEVDVLSRFMSDPEDYHIRAMTVEFRFDQFLLDTLVDLLEPRFYLDQLRGFDACFVSHKFKTP